VLSSNLQKRTRCSRNMVQEDPDNSINISISLRVKQEMFEGEITKVNKSGEI